LQYWTVEEARAYLPRLNLLLGVIRRASHLAVNARGNGHATLPGSTRAAVADPTPADPTPADPTPADPTPADPTPAEPTPVGPTPAEPTPVGPTPAEPTPVGPTPAEPPPAAVDLPVSFDAEAALEELQEKGIVLRDPDRGLIDFPAKHPGGREVLLCWQLGEEDLSWWHLPEDGFAGRRPLPLPPEL